MRFKRLVISIVLCSATFAVAQDFPTRVEIAPRSNDVTRRMVLDVDKEPMLSREEKLKLIRQHIKYVFVLFQENRSFDFYFGTYPGADGLYSKPKDEIAGFTQQIVNLDGTVGTISPFRIPTTITDVNGKTVTIYPTDMASMNHSHLGIARKLNLDENQVARNDQYSLTEEGVTLIDGKPSKVPTLEKKQFGELVMGHVDCDVAPFMWQYADRFTLFDHFFDTVIGPSGPNAIAMVAGQSGQTQWMLHPELGEVKGVTQLPLVENARPYWGLAVDDAGKPKKPEPNKSKNVAPNLTFASLPLSFMGDKIETTTAADYNPAFDLMDVQEDIQKIAGHGVPPINWGWYQQGYGHEPTDPVGVATHKSYVSHHNALQYFGYVMNNPEASGHIHGMGDFFEDVKARRLPSSGVFYVRGGYGNIAGMTPADPNPKLATVFNGNDDHPGYSDSGITEAFLAKDINAIAESPYWSQSAILIAYDESDGEYDHARPRIRARNPEGVPLNQGPRIPFILISPYGVAHGISHERDEHSSVIKFVNEVFGLIPLADLPDEERARKIGVEKYGQENLGPTDDKLKDVGDLLTGFDNLRLLGKRKPLPPSYAEIPEAEVESFPHMGGHGCRMLGITPTDAGLPNHVPADFNPRPDVSPGIPSSGHWVP